MSDEATVHSSLQIRKGNLNYTALPSAFQADVAGSKGPSPGAINVSRNGTTVSFPELTNPGLVRLMNLDETYWCDWGVWNPAQTEFYPVGRLLPGESFVFRFSPDLREEYSAPGTGTGTGGAGSSEFRLKAQWESGVTGVNALVEAFES